MNRNRFSVGLITAVAVVAISLGTGLSGPARYANGGPPRGPSYAIVKLVDDGRAYTDVMAWDINSSGRIVGQVNEPGPVFRAAYWELNTSGGTIRSSFQLLSGGVTAYGINDSGEIVGGGYDENGKEIALYWPGPGADPLDLPPLPGHDGSFAQSINNDGVICGHSKIDGGMPDTFRAVAWRVGVVAGSPVVWGPIALPDGGTGSYATSINDNDASRIAEVAGSFSDADPAAVIWSVQSLADGTLVAAPAPVVLDLDAEAWGINDSGTACGTLFPTPVNAVVWTGSSRRILNRAKFVVSARANDINNNGVIVGTGDYWRSYEQGLRATVWPSATSSMILLDKFLVAGSPFSHLTHAEAVNDQGMIVGYGWMGSLGTNRAFVAVPK